jgi:hypothetical protein
LDFLDVGARWLGYNLLYLLIARVLAFFVYLVTYKNYRGVTKI